MNTEKLNAAVQEFARKKKANSAYYEENWNEGELDSDSVVKEYLTTAADGKNYRTKHYNLDVIISVGYRVKSIRGTQFRQWATKRLNGTVAIVGKTLVNNKKRKLEKRNNMKTVWSGLRRSWKSSAKRYSRGTVSTVFASP